MNERFEEKTRLGSAAFIDFLRSSYVHDIIIIITFNHKRLSSALVFCVVHRAKFFILSEGDNKEIGMSMIARCLG